MEKRTVDTSEKRKITYGASDPLPVMEHFLTLQGEGMWTGTAAYFIRLAGCDVGCHWCDVKESWEVAPQQFLSIAELAKAVADTQAQHVVVTGGEPTIYNLAPLVEALHALELQVHIETAGVHPLKGEFDWVCFSPKKFMAPQPAFYERADELKVVVYNRHDLAWAEDHASQCAPHVALLLQPEWSKREQMLPEILAYIQQKPHWRLSQQTHKYLGIP